MYNGTLSMSSECQNIQAGVTLGMSSECQNIQASVTLGMSSGCQISRQVSLIQHVTFPPPPPPQIVHFSFDTVSKTSTSKASKSPWKGESISASKKPKSGKDDEGQ